MELRKTFGANLRRARRKRGLSQEALADQAEVERSYVGKLENAQFSVSPDTIERIAAALEIEAFELLRPLKRSAA